MLTAGLHHSCALLNNSGVMCWGTNNFGQIGDGTTTSPRNSPVSVINLAGSVTQISASNVHSCVLLHNGTIQCWGRNVNGLLGDGTSITPRTSPVSVIGIQGFVTQVSCGFDYSISPNQHTCALMSDVAWDAYHSSRVQKTYFARSNFTTSDSRHNLNSRTFFIIIKLAIMSHAEQHSQSFKLSCNLNASQSRSNWLAGSKGKERIIFITHCIKQ